MHGAWLVGCVTWVMRVHSMRTREEAHELRKKEAGICTAFVVDGGFLIACCHRRYAGGEQCAWHVSLWRVRRPFDTVIDGGTMDGLHGPVKAYVSIHTVLFNIQIPRPVPLSSHRELGQPTLC